MPIKADKLRQAPAQLQEIGRLFKGTKKQEKTSRKGDTYLGYGKDLEYFRFEPNARLRFLPSETHRDLLEEIEERWASDEMKKITADYRSIPILLPYKTLGENYWFRNAVHDGKGQCVRSCDGNICSKYQVDATKADGRPYKAVVTGAINCSMVEGQKDCPMGCKAEGKLTMIIRALYPGTVLITTKSEIDIATLNANLKAYEGYDLSKIPMRLCRSLRDASYWDNGEYKKQEKWLCHIEVDPEYGRMALEAQQRNNMAELMGVSSASLQLPGQRQAIALPAAPADQYPQRVEVLNEIKAQVAECVRDSDREGLEEAIAAAYRRIDYGALPEAARNAIATLHDEALTSIGANAVQAQPAQAQPVQDRVTTAPTRKLQRSAAPKTEAATSVDVTSVEVDPTQTPEAIALSARLGVIKNLAGLSDKQLLTVCKNLELSGAKFYEWTLEQVAAFRSHVFATHLFPAVSPGERLPIIDRAIADLYAAGKGQDFSDAELFEILKKQPEFVPQGNEDEIEF